jgi:hypothetical protein
MKPNFQQKLKSYIRLLKLFEQDLKKYHQLFENDDYKIEYIVRRDRYSNEIEFILVVSIFKVRLWREITRENNTVRKSLENYCRYFSITKYSVVRPLKLKSSRHKELPTTNIPPIEERVGFDLYMRESRWYVV